VCAGQPVNFAIRSGQGLTFNLSAVNGTILDSNGVQITSLVALQSGFNGRFVPNTLGAYIRITSIANNTGNCFSLVPPPDATVGVLSGPIFISSSSECSPQTANQYNAYVELSGTVTNVTIEGVAAVEDPPLSNIWWRTFAPFTSYTTSVPYFAQNGNCSISGTIDLPNCSGSNVCLPQPGNVLIGATLPTCGIQDVLVSFISSSLGWIGSGSGSEYEWISIQGTPQNPVEYVLEGRNPIINPTSLSITLQTSFGGNNRVKLKIYQNGGVCVYESNVIDLLAITSPEPSIIGPTVAITTTGYYQYQVAAVPGGSYAWTLTNSAGTVPIGVTTSNIVTINNFLAGLNTIGITVTNGDGCTGTDSLPISVNLACPEVVTIQAVSGSAALNCKNLTGVVNFLPPGVTITSHEWYFGGTVLTQSGVGVTITPLDTSVIAPGDTESVTLRVYFSDSCIVTSAAYSYTRAAAVNTVSKVLKAPGGAAMNFATTNYWITTARGRACASQGGAG
ncbi:MAG: hypothetical protein WAT70_01925, partial [Rhizobiaceae bacterium]